MILTNFLKIPGGEDLFACQVTGGPTVYHTMTTTLRYLPLACAAILACTTPVVAAETPTVAPAAATAPAPAINIAFGKKALKIVDPSVTAAQAGLDTLKAGAGFGIGGDKAKKKIEKAQGQVDTGKALRADLALVADGKPPAKDGVIASLTESNPNKPGMMEKLKAIPGIDQVTGILLTPGVPEALMSMAPIDKVPGATALAGFLSKP